MGARTLTCFFVRHSDTKELEDAILTLSARSLEGEASSLPTPAFPSRPDIRHGKKRTLILVPGGDRWVAIAEGGGVADETICRRLSRLLNTECIITGLYEVVNAWALRRYGWE